MCHPLHGLGILQVILQRSCIFPPPLFAFEPSLALHARQGICCLKHTPLF
eukprot:m.19211 g.19211  ORF g.19211 m.19211 type:complete len:50 (+) comp8638_c0_seq1:46-195(+)